MRTGLVVALTLVLALASWAPSAVATGEPGSGCVDGATTIECPWVTTAIVSAAANRRAILVTVRVSSQARVQVFGQVSWRVRQRDGSSQALLQGISAGAPRTVAPGVLRIFRVPLGKALSRRLGRVTGGRR
ncbi:MAG TPA: hypothetical protein VGO13_09180 [Solirubrobacterales bacterium]|jgi:hypothetical protein|nr:hypothetical protein [Solirubrobacterales bacterium]